MKKRLTNLVTFDEFNGMSVKDDRSIRCLFGPQWEGPRELRKKRGFYPKHGHLKNVGKYLLQGMCNSRVQRLVGCSKGTIQRFRKYLVHLHGEIYCKCGKPSNHGTRCPIQWSEREKAN